jgi:transposase, IS30 family
MTKKYNQLTLEQRYKIEALIKAGKSQSETAGHIGVHRSTISRELRRNVPQRGMGAKVYVAIVAGRKTAERHRRKNKRIRFTPELKAVMGEWMSQKRYSPELVSARWAKEGGAGVSHETMYKFIWACKHGNQRMHHRYKNLYKQLKHGRRKRRRGNYKDSRGIIPNRVPIEKRPKIVSKRKRFGDFEADLIMGERHKSALLITIDRATLITTIDRMKGKNAQAITQKIIRRMKKLPPLKTMTFDNDQAFSRHEEIARHLNIKTYFTRPYTSQDKGTIENRNGIIRMFFPKKTNFEKISLKEIRRVEKEINNRPVRKFNYLTPNEVFSRLKGSVALMS